MTANYFQMQWSPEVNLFIPREDIAKNVQVDVSKWVKSKQSLSYIPWNVSRGLLRSYNPSLEAGFEQDQHNRPYFVTDGGVYLLAFVYDKASGKRTPSMLHAVRGFGNKSDPNPTIDTIINATQRAYSKVISLETGLGWSLYSKLDESIDLDDEETFKPKAPQPSYSNKAATNGKGVAAAKRTDEDW